MKFFFLKFPIVTVFIITFIFSCGDPSKTVEKTNSDSLPDSTAESVAKVEFDSSEFYFKSNPAKAYDFVLSCMEIARKENNHKWITSAYHQLGRLQMKLGKKEEAGKTYRDALDYEENVKPREEKKLAWVYFNVANYHKRQGDYKTAVVFFLKSLEIETKVKNRDRQGSCLLNLGGMYEYMAQLDSAEFYLNQSMEISLADKDSATLQSALTNLGLIYESKGEYAKALDYFEQCLNYIDKEGFDAAQTYANMAIVFYNKGQRDKATEYYEHAITIFNRKGNEIEAAMTILNLGTLLEEEELYEKAISYYEKAIPVFNKAGNADLEAAACLALGSVYDKTGQPDKSYEEFKEALRLSEQTGNQGYIATAYQNMGAVEKKKGNYALAIEHALKANEICKKIGDKRLLAESYALLGELYADTRNFSLAREALSQAQKLGEEIGALSPLSKTYDSFVRVYSAEHDNGRSYEYHTLQLDVLDSLRKEKNFQTIQEMLTRYQVKEKEDSLLLQKVEIERQGLLNKQKDERNRQDTNLLIIVIAGLCLVSIFGIIALLNFQKKKKANEQLEKQNAIIEQKNNENELLLAEIHHRVKNNLQLVSSLLSLQGKNVADTGVKHALEEGKERIRAIGLIHEKLYQQNFYQGVEMDKYTGELIKGLLAGLANLDVKPEIAVQPLNLDVDTAIPLGLIINELVTNALKYAYKDVQQPTLRVSLQEKEKQLVLEVADNGNGNHANVLDSQSFGMKMIHSLVKQLNGTLAIVQNNGLLFRIVITDYKLLG